MWVTGVGHTGVGDMLGSAAVESIAADGCDVLDAVGLSDPDTSSMAKEKNSRYSS